MQNCVSNCTKRLLMTPGMLNQCNSWPCPFFQARTLCNITKHKGHCVMIDNENGASGIAILGIINQRMLLAIHVFYTLFRKRSNFVLQISVLHNELCVTHQTHCYHFLSIYLTCPIPYFLMPNNTNKDRK